MQRPDTEDGLFHEGDPLTGQRGTRIPAAWLNALLAIGAFLSGEEAAPPAELGGEGDFYLSRADPNTPRLYGPRSAEGWPAEGVSLVGVGPQGPAGSPYKAYSTLAAANADLVNIPANGLVWVNNDGANNGYWSKIGGVLSKTSTDPGAQSVHDKLVSVAGSGALTEDFSFNSGMTATNITDATNPVYAATYSAAGMQIVLTTGSRLILFSTHNKTGGSRTRITAKFNASAFAATCSVGLAFSDGVNRSAFDYAQNGRLSQTNTYGGGGVISTALDTFAAGATITLLFDIYPDGTVIITGGKDGGKQFQFRFTGIPLGTVYLLQKGASTVTHLLSIENLGGLTEKEILYESERELSQTDRNGMNAVWGLLSDLARAVPAGFTATIPPEFSAFKKSTARSFFTSIDLRPILSELDSRNLIIHVDVATGSDTNPGTAAAPVKSIHEAMVRSTGNTIIKIKPGLYDKANCWDGIGPTGSVIQVVPWGAGDIISSMHDSGLAWALDSGSTYVAIFAGTVLNVWDAAHPTADDDYQRLPLAASLAVCQATAGTYFIAGTSIYVHASDGRAPDANIRVYKQNTPTHNGNYEVAGGQIYIEGVRFEGGQSPFFNRLANPATSMKVYVKRCSFLYGTSDGFDINGDTVVIAQNCICAWNNQDGFNYHAIFGSLSPQVVEINCIGRWNGLDTSNTNNGSTIHEAGSIIRVGGVYHHNQNRNIHDIQGSLSWNMGVTARDCQTAYANFVAGVDGDGTATKMWLDCCTSSGSAYDLETVAGSTIYTNDLVSGGANKAGSTITPYVA